MKNKFILILIVLISVLTGAIAFSNTSSEAQRLTEDPTITYYPDVEQEIFDKTNELRVSKGLNVLEYQSDLRPSARVWAVKLSIDLKVSHSDPRLAAPKGAIWLGENVGITDNSTQALELLIASPKHYANLVDPRFTHMEVGGVEIMGSYYFAQEFMQLPVEETTTTQAPIATTTPKKSATVCK